MFAVPWRHLSPPVTGQWTDGHQTDITHHGWQRHTQLTVWPHERHGSQEKPIWQRKATQRSHDITQSNAMMTSSNGKIFRVTGHLCGEYSPHKGQWRWALMFSFYIRLNKRLSKQSKRRWSETPPCPLWRQCNAIQRCHDITQSNVTWHCINYHWWIPLTKGQ